VPATEAVSRAIIDAQLADQGWIENLQVPLPSLTEQRRIVDILARADGIIRLRGEAQKKTQEIISALFLDTFGDPARNPKGWASAPLKEVAEIGSGVTKGRKLGTVATVEVPYLRVANVQDGRLDLAEIKRISLKHGEIEKYGLQPGDLLMTEGGNADKLGRAALWNGEVDICAHQNHVFRVRCRRELLLPEFLRALCGSAYGKQYFLKVAKRTTGIASINKTQLSRFPVLLPPLPTQAQFANRVASVRAIEALARDAAAGAAVTFGSLLSRAFLGLN
jgi:type I restriction enzyme S subunit